MVVVAGAGKTRGRVVEAGDNVDIVAEGRERGEALRRACAAGAIAASRFGAQPSLPTADEVDAILS